MAKYFTTSRASNIPVVVATGTAVKTVLQIAVPSTASLDRILAWGISFDGVTAGAVPGIVSLMDTDVAATVTTVTPMAWNHTDELASACVGGTALTGYNASAEGTIGATTRELDTQLVHPQTGYSLWFPATDQPKVKPSRFLRIRCTFAATVNALPWILHAE